MSRIILSKYPSGQERLVVGWDHPAGGAFWQEFNEEPASHIYPANWQEVKRDGGFFPGIPLERFYDSVPQDLHDYITDEVLDLLAAHRADPDSGYNTRPIDLT